MDDEMIRRISEPEAQASPTAKAAARRRLLAAAEAEQATPRHKRLRVGGRGVAVFMALLAVPAGVALASELTSNARLKSVDDCPELAAAIAADGLSSDGLQVPECPTGAEVDETIRILGMLEAQRAALEDRLEGQRVTVIDSSDEQGAWAIDGIVGASESLREWGRR